MKNLVNAAFLCMLLLTTSGCRSTDGDSMLDDSGPFSPFAPEDGGCPSEFTSDHYYIRPVTGGFPYYEIDVCLDAKFNFFHSKFIVFADANTSRNIPPENLKVEIATEYTVGIFETIRFTDEGQSYSISRDYPEQSFEGPMQAVPLYKFEVENAEGKPGVVRPFYQSNLEDECPREWFISDESNQVYRTKSNELIVRMNVCQLSSAEGTTYQLPLSLSLERLPEILSGKITKRDFRFHELVSTSNHRNFQNKIYIDNLAVLRDQDPQHEEGEIGLQPGKRRSYYFEAAPENCNTIDKITNCADKPAWTYDVYRDCPSIPPPGNCEAGQMTGEYYCHGDIWRCRYLQSSALTYEDIPTASKGEPCELGDDTMFFPKCSAGLSCDMNLDNGDTTCQ